NQRAHQQTHSLHQKHSSLNLIESSLDSFALDLHDALSSSSSSTDQESNKRIVLAAEESVSKAMFEIDSVDSEGDLGVRQRRKELIKKSQDLLELVDSFKARESNTGKQVVRDAPVSTSAAEVATPEVLAETSSSSSSSSSEETEVIVLEAEPIDEDDEEEVADLFPTAEEDDDEDEIAPYNVNVAVASAPSPSESETVQDDKEVEVQVEEETGPESEDVTVEVAKSTDSPAVVEEERTIETEKETPGPAKEAKNLGSESGHDDFEIVPEF
ncbi:hypothetical protein F5H01DRAFT_175762, partial [Linnemannia elongata]